MRVLFAGESLSSIKLKADKREIQKDRVGQRKEKREKRDKES